jgi:hypothetical protein
MIEFTRIPYARAQLRARVQNWVVGVVAGAVLIVVLALVGVLLK